MFNNNKKREAERIFQIFNTLLLKVQKQPLHITEAEVIKIYKWATKIAKTTENLEYIYMQTGEIDKNITEGEEKYE